MKKLLVLTVLGVLAAGSIGCQQLPSSCTRLFRGSSAATPTAAVMAPAPVVTCYDPCSAPAPCDPCGPVAAPAGTLLPAPAMGN